MRIIPVIDLMGGVVVRGIGGRRDEYRPIVSQIAAEPTPTAVAAAFRDLGYDTAYVADLDAIAGRPRDWKSYEQMASVGMSLWIDAGIRNPNCADEMLRFDPSGKKLTGIVVGSETISTEDLYYFVVSRLGERMIFSLDLRGDEVLADSWTWQGMRPIDLAKQVIGDRLRRLIVLDLTSVGGGQGVRTESLCREIRRLDSNLELISGGGVRGRGDLELLEQAGCDAALVASALHDGRM